MTGEWTPAVSVSEIPDDEVIAVAVNGRDLAVYKIEESIYATDNLCTHGAARLSDGFLEGREIECPLHQGRFDVCTGKALCVPLTADLKTYPVKIEAGQVMVKLDT